MRHVRSRLVGGGGVSSPIQKVNEILVLPPSFSHILGGGKRVLGSFIFVHLVVDDCACQFSVQN